MRAYQGFKPRIDVVTFLGVLICEASSLSSLNMPRIPAAQTRRRRRRAKEGAWRNYHSSLAFPSYLFAFLHLALSPLASPFNLFAFLLPS